MVPLIPASCSTRCASTPAPLTRARHASLWRSAASSRALASGSPQAAEPESPSVQLLPAIATQGREGAPSPAVWHAALAPARLRRLLLLLLLVLVLVLFFLLLPALRCCPPIRLADGADAFCTPLLWQPSPVTSPCPTPAPAAWHTVSCPSSWSPCLWPGRASGRGFGRSSVCVTRVTRPTPVHEPLWNRKCAPTFTCSGCRTCPHPSHGNKRMLSETLDALPTELTGQQSTALF